MRTGSPLIRKALWVCAVLLVPIFVCSFAPMEDQEAVNKYIADGDSFDSGLNTALGKAKTAMFGVLEGLLVIAGLGASVLAVIQMMNGDRTAAKRIMYWGLGLVLGFAMLAVLGNFNITGGKGLETASSGGDFATLKSAVSEALQLAFIIISGVCVVIVSVRIMHGEQDGFRNLYTWLIGSVIGLTLLMLV